MSALVLYQVGLAAAGHGVLHGGDGAHPRPHAHLGDETAGHLLDLGIGDDEEEEEEEEEEDDDDGGDGGNDGSEKQQRPHGHMRMQVFMRQTKGLAQTCSGLMALGV